MTQAAILFDTHRFVRNLVASGFTEKQAEALADEQITLLNSNLATKTDIEAVKYEMESLRLSTQADMNDMRLSTQASIEKAKSETLKWMFGALVAHGTLIVGLIVALEELL